MDDSMNGERRGVAFGDGPIILSIYGDQFALFVCLESRLQSHARQ